MYYPTLFLAAALTLAFATTAYAQDPKPTLTPFATGFTQPIDITNAGDGTNRLFVNEKTGRVKVLGADGSVIGTFLDLSAKVSTNGERGLLGLAFAPDYRTSGRFYVNYTNRAGNTVIARYGVSATNPDLADAASEEVLLTIAQPYDNHNGGDLAFGPDGLLYVASGDGGSGDDPQAKAQDKNSLLGKILRLDVSGATGYTAAGDYPGAAAEVFAVGLRNPWRISFDRATDSLWIGDVGQNAREEIDVLTPNSANRNFGWVCYEGSSVNTGVASAANSNCQPYASYAAPIFEYEHSVGRSVTGGVVYRGSAYPILRGYYFFADYSSGRGFALRGSGATQRTFQYPSFGNGIVGFGESETGEVYVVSIFGTVNQLTAEGVVGARSVATGSARTLHTYPNPVTLGAVVTVTLPDERRLVTVSDALGRAAMTIDPGGRARVTFTTASLPAGNYFIRQGNRVARLLITQ